MRLRLAACLFLLLSQTALAWETPTRGSADRRGMMDAMRPIAEWNLGAPVEFVVHDLRVDGGLGFASVTPQRPGGGWINPMTTPMALRDGMDMSYLEVANMQALLQKQGNAWVVVYSLIGATDVWWSERRLCEHWGRVTPEVC